MAIAPDCNNVYLTDLNGKFTEEFNGQFVLADTGGAWDGGWPPLTSSDGGYTLATPIWEASAVLTSREDCVISSSNCTCATGVACNTSRQIYTVLPNGTTGTYSSTMVLINDSSQLSGIADAMQLGSVNGDLCTTLGDLTRHSYDAGVTDCAKDVIAFMEGAGTFSSNSPRTVRLTHLRPFIRRAPISWGISSTRRPPS